MERETHIAYIKMFSLILATIFYVTFVFFSFFYGRTLLDWTYLVKDKFFGQDILTWKSFRHGIFGKVYFRLDIF